MTANDVVMDNEKVSNSGTNYTYLGGTTQVNEPSEAYGTHSRIKLIRRGLPVQSLTIFLKESGLNRQELGHILQVSPRTMQRYDSNQMLPINVTEKLLMLNDLFEKANDVLGGDSKNISGWLHSTVPALGNQRPLDLLDTYQGFNEVMKVLGRIEWGIAS
ncbi:type II RES/Xre toxin-antitoxin system antitoxin [Owenweeksia hongkongensis]|uniref:type II RES/Xre toxin-antitoxin system antitoxin n=1 Tax=Owenweeksia hongkongensis TaxID=253245 RepID=UPI00117ECE5E|nr:antitoxin Xre/MbcA/ParS toxin-binding domain-containing protein [Owenweeksia hongkongensis]